MAWNEPGNSNNGKDPWTGKPKPNNPPDLEAILRNAQKKLKQLLSQKSGSGGNNTGGSGAQRSFNFKFNPLTVSLLVILLLILWGAWGLFIVGPAEQAVVLRFGRYIETLGPGPHWIARPFSTAYIVNEGRVDTYSYTAEMLTQDENIVSVSVAVQYRIADARAYLFNVVRPSESLQQATASALRQVIGQTKLDAVLTTGREQIRQQVQVQLVKILAKYNTGLLITDVAMQPAKAPEEVKEAFDDAIKAQEDEQRFENQAQSYAMQVVPIAKGEAQRLLTAAKAYQQQAVLQAQAETAQFLALLPSYQQAPVIMRERLYLETMQKLLANNNKILLATSNANNVLYLPIDKLFPAASDKLATSSVPATPTPLLTNSTAAAPPANTATANNATTDSTTSSTAAFGPRLQGGYQ